MLKTLSRITLTSCCIYVLLRYLISLIDPYVVDYDDMHRMGPALSGYLP